MYARSNPASSFLLFLSMQVELSNYEKYLKYRRPDGFEFQYSGDKTYVEAHNQANKFGLFSSRKF